MKKLSIALLMTITLFAAKAFAAEEVVSLIKSISKTYKNFNFIGATMINLNADTDSNHIIGYSDTSIVKISNGNNIKIYETNYAPDGVYDEVTDNKGNRYVACFAHNGKNNDIGTIKFNAHGKMEWVRIFDSGDKDISWVITVDKAGNVYTANFSYLGEDAAIRTIKYNPDGKMEWTVLYNKEGADKPKTISLNKKGNVCVKCFSEDKGFYTITYDTNGNQL